MKLLLSLFFGVFCLFLQADNSLGYVLKVEGIAKVTKQGSIQKKTLYQSQKLYLHDLITTSNRSTLVLELQDSSHIILDPNSSLHFTTPLDFEQNGGKIYYKISSRDAKNALKVQTPFSIIGIKGTEFIVNAQQQKQGVKLKEGLLGIASIKEEFELYRQSVYAKYQQFLAEQNKAFEEFKNAQNPAFVERVKEFDIQEHSSLSFDGNIVKEKVWSEADDAEFAYFEEMIR